MFKYEIASFGEFEQLERNYPNAKILGFTNESWHLLGAQAVKFNPNFSYVLVKIKREHLVIGESLLKYVEEITGVSPRVLMHFNGENLLKKIIVSHPLTKKALPLIPDLTMRQDKGTGLDTVTPGHNPKDLRLLRKFNT